MGEMVEAELIHIFNFRYWRFEMIYRECLKIRVDNLAYITANLENIRGNHDFSTNDVFNIALCISVWDFRLNT